jgi:RNA recognition motif-containing protein
MAALPMELPKNVCVLNTFVTVRPDDYEPIRRTRSASCPPCVRSAAGTMPRAAGAAGAPMTVLVKNLPCRGRVNRLFAHLDLGFAGKYDYVHAPMDTKTGMLKGFAFVNFPDPSHAACFMQFVEGTQLRGSESKRTLTACLAANQGIEANLAALSGMRKRNRSKVFGLPWVRLDGEMQPIQETGKALALK